MRKIIEGIFEVSSKIYNWDMGNLDIPVKVGDLAVVEVGRPTIDESLTPKIIEVVGVKEYTDKELIKELDLDEAYKLDRFFNKVISIIPKEKGYAFIKNKGAELNLVSPTNNKNYVVMDAIEKGKHRSNLLSDEFSIGLFREHYIYGDKDLLINIRNFRCSDSVWTESISFNIPELILALHIKKGTNAYQVGYCHLETGDDDLFSLSCENIYKCLKKEGIWFEKMEFKCGDKLDEISYENITSFEFNEIKKLIMSHINSELMLEKISKLK